MIPLLHLATVIEGGTAYAGSSDLSRSSTFVGQRDNTASAAFSVLAACSAAGGMGGACSLLDSRMPHAEKVSAHRSRQNKGAASLTKAHGAFRKIGEAVNRQGTLTITGSNVRLGTEMPVALSLSFA